MNTETGEIQQFTEDELVKMTAFERSKWAPMGVEPTPPRYGVLKDKAKAAHRSLKGEVLWLMEKVYGNDDASASQDKQEAAAQQAGAA